jgi:hypothetical protein
MTEEENLKIVAAELDTWKTGLKARKESLVKPVCTEKQNTWAKGMLELPRQYDLHHKPDDYKRTLQKKADSAKAERSKRDVPQLGEQAKQAISPLKVGDDHHVSIQRRLEFAAECGLTLSQVDPTAPEIEAAPLAFNYVKGGPMVRPGVHAEDLPTRLRALNKWYEKVAKEGRTLFYFMAGKDHFLRQDYWIPITMEELFRFFNLRDIDISLVSCYTL